MASVSWDGGAPALGMQRTALFSSVRPHLQFSELIFLVLLSTYYLPCPVLILEIP